MKSSLLEYEQAIKANKQTILSEFNHHSERNKIPYEDLQKKYHLVIKRQIELVKLLTATQRQISKYFMTYAPLQFNPTTFTDLSHFGGPKIASNQNKLYIGSIVDGKRHGKGLIISQKGKIYEGQLSNNDRNGSGVEIYTKSNFYFGNFANNKRQGTGVMVWIINRNDYHFDYQYFVGEWREGDPHGNGFHYTNQWSYYGAFKNGMRHGKGIELIGDKSIYSGQFCNNYQDGKGFYYQNQNQCYEGDFKLGERLGYGTWYSLKTKEKYQGFFQNNKKEGIGLYERKDGLVYRGLFRADQPCGAGQFFRLPSKEKYKFDDNRTSTELMIRAKKTIQMKRPNLQSAMLPRSNNNQLKKSQSKLAKMHLLSQQACEKMSPKSTIKVQDKRLYRSKVSLSSAKLRSINNPQCRKSCANKYCSCHKGIKQQSQKKHFDEKKMHALYSSRKQLLKNII